MHARAHAVLLLGPDAAGAVEGGERRGRVGHRDRPVELRLRRRPRDRVAGLTAVLNRRRGWLRRCFDRHTESPEGTPQISVRFQVRAGGSIESAQVSPAALAPTPLGRCLHGVAVSTEFGRQPGPAAFRILISVRGDRALPDRDEELFGARETRRAAVGREAGIGLARAGGCTLGASPYILVGWRVSYPT